MAHKGQRGKAAVHKHRVRRAEIQVHEARRRVFSRKGAKKKWQKWKKIIQAVPRSPQDTEEALTPHTNLRRQRPWNRPGPRSGFRHGGQEGAGGECPNLLFFTRYINHGVTEHLQISLFLIFIVSYTCSSPTPTGSPQGAFSTSRPPPSRMLPEARSSLPAPRIERGTLKPS